MEKQEVAAQEVYPLGKNWWLSFYSKPSDHPELEYIHVEIGLGEYTKDITKILVPKIDGLVCESHSIIRHLIHQNTEALQKKLDRAVSLVEFAVKQMKFTDSLILDDYEKVNGPTISHIEAELKALGKG